MHAAKLKPRANYHKAKLNQTEIPAVTEKRYGSTSDLSFDDMRIRYSSSQMPLQLRAAVHTLRRRSYIVPGQESHLEVGTSQLERGVPVQSGVEQISGYGGVVQRMPEPEVGEQQIGEDGTEALRRGDVKVISRMTKEQLRLNLPQEWTYTEYNGRVHIKDEKGNFRVRIDPPDRRTNYQHMHVLNESGQSLDRDGNVVERKASGAHIPWGN